MTAGKETLSYERYRFPAYDGRGVGGVWKGGCRWLCKWVERKSGQKEDVKGILSAVLDGDFEVDF